MSKLPHAWRLNLLSEFIERLDAGVSVNSEDVRARSGEAAVLKSSCVYDGVFHPDENKRILLTEIHRACIPVRKGTIIISRSNTQSLVGESAFVADDHPNLFHSDKLWQTVFSDRTKFCPRWLSQFLASPGFRRRVGTLATGTSGSMKNISKETFLSLGILTPPYKEQKAIAEILSSWDQRIRRTDEIIRASTLLKRGLMQQLLTGRKRLLEGHDQAWRSVELGKVFKERRETNLPHLELLAITSSDGVVKRNSLEKRDMSNPNKAAYLRIIPGDIGYNTMRMWQGVSGLSEHAGIISPAYTVCIPTRDIDGRFARHLFKYEPVIHLFKRYSQGLVDDTLGLKFEAFAQIKISLPPVVEQRRIARVLDACDKGIELLRRQLDGLKLQKRGLMQKLLTGQIRVKVQ